MSKEDAALWAGLAGSARAGELYLDDEQASLSCTKACDQHLADLQSILEIAQDTKNVSGFGNFKMADDLVKKFLAQATGEDRSIDAVIREHIDVVMNMREVFALSFKRITGQDIENTATITAAGQVP
ncbi:hypothetical protein [Nocardia cyriacigeorgica]|uniref:hypothetical protein n=1 Tax=Nocardia cyriacigeorgica TaxID=135487 RepID=UPI0018931ABF|nr:hypothetical protein [Nocardia cyriacigeorgica]MBF6289842.1 hypothetical protein [Nocardia cyriacigeorgica]BDT89251.1 hypothetical protein FMUAM8_50150 [Nocardia cyriacigeorgica]